MDKFRKQFIAYLGMRERDKQFDKIREAYKQEKTLEEGLDALGQESIGKADAIKESEDYRKAEVHGEHFNNTRADMVSRIRSGLELILSEADLDKVIGAAALSLNHDEPSSDTSKTFKQYSNICLYLSPPEGKDGEKISQHAFAEISKTLPDVIAKSVTGDASEATKKSFGKYAMSFASRDYIMKKVKTEYDRLKTEIENLGARGITNYVKEHAVEDDDLLGFAETFYSLSEKKK